MQGYKLGLDITPLHKFPVSVVNWGLWVLSGISQYSCFIQAPAIVLQSNRLYNALWVVGRPGTRTDTPTCGNSASKMTCPSPGCAVQDLNDQSIGGFSNILPRDNRGRSMGPLTSPLPHFCFRKHHPSRPFPFLCPSGGADELKEEEPQGAQHHVARRGAALLKGFPMILELRNLLD